MTLSAVGGTLSTVGGTIAGLEFSPLDIDWHTLFWADEITGLGDGDPVATWADSSGNGHDATQVTAAKRPVFRPAFAGLNNRAAVEFDGVDDVLQTAGFAELSGVTEHVSVVSLAVSAVDQQMMNGVVSAKRRQVGTDGATTSWKLYSGSILPVVGGTTDTAGHYVRGRFAATDTIHVDGTQVASGDAGSEGLTGVTLGANPTGVQQFLQGHLAFVGLVDRTLTAQENADLLAWSRSYYGTP